MSRKPDPSVFTAKTSFLSSQVRQLGVLPQPPSRWRDNLPASDEHGDLSDAVLHQVFYKLSLVAKKHHNLVYSAQALRHHAEQVDALYWSASEGSEEGDLGAEAAVLRAGVDLRLKENIDALPEDYPHEEGESEEDLEMYRELRARLRTANDILASQRQKKAYYEHLRPMVQPFASPLKNVQPNLVTRDSALNAELERTKRLALLLAVQLEKAGLKVLQEEGREDDEDEEMKGEDENEDEKAADRKFAQLRMLVGK